MAGEEYFDSYDDLEVHRLMLSDAPRTEAYRDAIMKNKHFFQDKVVMDVGAGSGILSLFCFQAGAKKVYAIEASPLASLLKQIVTVNGADKVIEVIHKKVEEVEICEKVDVIISEWMGFYLLHESMLDSVLTARDKHLKEDGIMMPSHATIYAAPCSLKSLKRKTVDYWSNVYGFNMKPMAREALKRTKPEVTVIGPGETLSKATTIIELDLKYTESSELNTITSRTFVSTSKIDAFQGLALWFTTDFFNYEDNNWTNVSLDTSPESPQTHWMQTIVPIFGEDPEEILEEGEIIGWELKLHRPDPTTRQYSIMVEVLDPGQAEHPVPCDCQMAKCALIAALMEKEDAEMLE